MRVLLAQKEVDRRRGLDTAGFVSGYRGSPLGGVDMTLWSVADRLKAANILFVPGVNEDIAATSMRGTQQLDAVPDPVCEGVFAAWYGKGPGVDRSGDALKHGNYAGVHRNGGVVVFYGDDHGGKSSSVAHHSEQAMAASLIPSLYPANVAEIIEYGLLAYAMSRYSGSWVGLKCVNEVVEQTASVDIDVDGFSPVNPPYSSLPPEGIHIHSGPFRPLREEQIVAEYRLPLVQHFVRANQIDRVIFLSRAPRLGLVSAGKSYGDVRMALALLELTDNQASAYGISLYKIGCIWPLDAKGLVPFAVAHDTLFVVEEKKSFIEQQAAAALINHVDRPIVVGKLDEDGGALLSPTQQLEPFTIALEIVSRLERLGASNDALRASRDRLIAQTLSTEAPSDGGPRRSPYFCSGCPHSRSTRIPTGSLSMTGIGCHTMVNFVRPKEAMLPAQMGGEGANWIGLAPFTRTRHIFQNMGDGTYYHSGLLAIRAAVSAGINITYKILYNDAVAMTGGQPVDGPISVAEVAQQIYHERVRKIVIVSDDPDRHRDDSLLPPGTKVAHRDQLDVLQQELRDTPGCTVLIYEQTCAAEKRRRRKRGLLADPPKRLYIAKDVCEGCGDCSAQSTCVSLLPVQTEFGAKRRIDQSSCNKDYSCLNGFCPSFITVRDSEPRKPDGLRIETSLLDDLPAPRPPAAVNGSVNVMIAGIGGTGVTTVAAILSMAAHIDGLATSSFDMTGLAQKNGAVYSHLRIAHSTTDLHAQRIGRGEADVLLAFDIIASLGSEALHTLAQGRTRAVVNSDVAPTVAFQFDRDAAVDTALLLGRFGQYIGQQDLVSVDATTLAANLLGDSIGANLLLVGVAIQQGALPITVSAIEHAVRLNGAAVGLNLAAFRTGRLYAVNPTAVNQRSQATLDVASVSVATTLDDIINRREKHLSDYQSAAYARRYRMWVEKARLAEEGAMPGSRKLTVAIARVYSKLLAYKDEYEVARLLSGPGLQSELKRAFADGARVSFNLAPPFLLGKLVNGRPRKREFSAAAMLPVMRLLARLKWLRGTPLDPFGWSSERRMERFLIRQYEGLMQSLLPLLNSGNHSAALEIFALADNVRGFGPVKHAAATEYRKHLASAVEAFHAQSKSTRSAASAA